MALTEFLRGQPPAPRANGALPGAPFAFRVQLGSGEPTPEGVEHPWHDLGGRAAGDMNAIDEEFESLVGEVREGDFVRAVGPAQEVLAFGVVLEGRVSRVLSPVVLVLPGFSATERVAAWCGQDWVKFWRNMPEAETALTLASNAGVSPRLLGLAVADMARGLLPHGEESTPVLTRGVAAMVEWGRGALSTEALAEVEREVNEEAEALRESDVYGNIQYDVAAAVSVALEALSAVGFSALQLRLATQKIAQAQGRGEGDREPSLVDRDLARMVTARIPLRTMLLARQSMLRRQGM